MTISDVLADAVAEIEDLEQQGFGVEPDNAVELAAVKLAMNRLRKRLDAPPNLPKLTDAEVDAGLEAEAAAKTGAAAEPGPAPKRKGK
jgi:hypothetical protein